MTYLCVHMSHRNKDPLKEALVEPEIGTDSISSKHYKLVAGDLRDMSSVGDKVLGAGVDPRWGSIKG